MPAAAAVALSPVFLSAQRAEAQGHFARAERLYGQAYASDPSNTAALFGRARMQSWRGQFSAAIRDYRAGLARRPDDVEGLSGLGWTYAWSHHFKAATRVFRRLARLQPYDLDPKKGLAYVALWRGHARSARRQFQALRRQDPYNPDYTLAIGQAAYLEGDLPAARRAFERTLQLKPTLAAARSGLSAVRQAAIERHPALMLLGGLSSEGGLHHSGLRFAQLSLQVNHNLRLWLADDRGLGIDLFTPDRRIFNASTVTAGAFYTYTPRLGLQIEGGERRLPGQSDPVFAAEQVFFLGRNVPKVGFWWTKTPQSAQWIVYGGVYHRLSGRFSLEPTLYYAYDGRYHEGRAAVLATYTSAHRAQFGLGVALGQKQSATGGKGVTRVFGNVSVPIAPRITFMLYAWHEVTQGLPGETVVAAGFTAYL